MNKLQFKRIGLLIGFTLLVSISVQIYRNIAQFRIIQDQLVSDIQGSLDNALEAYFAEIAKTDVITFTDSFVTSGSRSTLTLEKDSMRNGFSEGAGKRKLMVKTFEHAENGTIDSVFWNSMESDSINPLMIDSLNTINVDRINKINIFRGQSPDDSLSNLKMLTNQIIISITRDSLDFQKINSLLQADLDRKGIDIQYGLLLIERDTISGSFNYPALTEMPFKTVSKSSFLPRGQTLEMYFENTALNILKRGIFEIITSILFLGIISGAFYYLYQTIKNQKEIAEIKEDLIGNITHEFKTPIATTLSAIEGIEKFNPENDPEKVKRYLGISKMQMHKLNQMVEKLLETATLDSEQLVLKKESIDPEPILRNLLDKYRTLDPEKEIELILPAKSRKIEVDPFHFENVISNLLDNALKYGGNQVRICMDQSNKTKIKIWDDGGKIGPEQKDRVFEQFYRIPQGNIHDVKGFGIGLYYVKKIIEKHGGKIELETAPKSTTFTTIWP